MSFFFGVLTGAALMFGGLTVIALRRIRRKGSVNSVEPVKEKVVVVKRTEQ